MHEYENWLTKQALLIEIIKMSDKREVNYTILTADAAANKWTIR